MPYFLTQAAYTSEAWAAQIRDPRDRIEIIGAVAERLGGRIVSAYLSFGDYDIVVISEFPDQEGVAALVMAVAAGGAVKSVKTTPLMTIDEGISAMRKATGSGYQPPGI
jgi:uncharacterized protein with GYD domain